MSNKIISMHKSKNCVKVVELSQLFNISNGYTPSKSVNEYWENGVIPWFRLEDIRKNGRILSDSIQHISKSAVRNKKLIPSNSIIISTTATIGEYALINTDFLTNQQITSLSLRKQYECEVNMKYIFHYCPYLSNWCKTNSNSSGGMSIINLNKMKVYKLPIPSIEFQNKIVRKLDNFTEIIEDLSIELTARKQQYEYYKTKLLFIDFNIQKFEIGKILKRTKGTNITAQHMSLLNKQNGEVRIFAGGKTIADVDFKDIPKKDIHTKPSIIVKSRGNIGFEYYDKPFSHKNEFWSYHCDDKNINLKYVYYYLQHNINYFQNIANNMQMPQISIPVTDKYLIPLPPLEKQNFIVGILDKFDKLVNDISVGIPAEIAARQKQYEYYRDKLLTFKEVGNESI